MAMRSISRGYGRAVGATRDRVKGVGATGCWFALAQPPILGCLLIIDFVGSRKEGDTSGARSVI